MVTLRTLGECVAEVGTNRVGPDAERLFAVLLCLGFERDRLATRAALTGLLWPDAAEDRGSHSLRQAVYRLRALGVPLLANRSHLWLEPGVLELDCAPLLAPSPEPEGFVTRIRGHFLAGYHPKFSDPYAEWLERQRDLVNARMRRLFLAEISRLKARGDWAGVECMAARCLTIDPLNEEATLARAEAAALQGGKTQALSILDGYLKEVGPDAREIRLPATVLRRRIAEATNLERPRAITETPFFGRAREMAELNRALHLAHAGSGSAYVFWGEPGIGKTRLMQEFTRAVSLGTAQIVRVGCQSNDDRRPLSMFVDMLPRLLGMPGALGCAPSAMRFLRRLTEHDPKEPLVSIDSRDAATVYANVRKSVLDLLDAVASESLLVLVIEDVHWLDSGSWDVIADALPWLSSRRVLVLLTSREPDAERNRGIRELPGLHRLHLAPLDRDAVNALSATIVERSGKSLAADVAEWCATSCGGNPYHLTELVLHGLREGRSSKLPASLSQLIAERLARLHPLSLHVLQGVAVLGAHSTLDRLERLLDQRRVDLLDALDELERSGLIESDSARLLSKHDLLSQAAVQRLSVSARRLLHRHAAVELERDALDAPAPAIQWSCAEHWREAGEVGRALSYLQECARYALETGAPANALELLDRALGIARDAHERQGIILHKAVALQHRGDWFAVRQVLDGSSQHGTDTDNVVVHDERELLLFETAWRTGTPLEHLYPELMRCVCSPAAASSHRLSAGILALKFCDNDRNNELAESIFGLMCPLLSDSNNTPDQLTAKVIFHCSFGDLDAAEKHSIRLAQISRQEQLAFPRVRGLMIAGTALRECGRESEAESAFNEAYSIAVANDMSSAAANSANSVAALLLQLGDLDRCRMWLNEVDSMVGRNVDKTVRDNWLGLRLRFALFANELVGIDGMLDSYRASASTNRLRFLSELMSHRVALRQTNPIASDATALRVHELHSALRSSCNSDLSAITVCEVLLSRSQPEETERFLTGYVENERRSRCKLAGELRAISSSLKNKRAAAGSS